MMTLTAEQGRELIAALEADSDAKKFPLCKLLMTWQDGTGETPWGRTLQGGMCAVENTPLYPKFRFRDIVRVQGFRNVVSDVIYRHYPTKIVFLYEPLEGEGDDPDLPRRKLLWNALESIPGARLTFFRQGKGDVLCTAEVSPADVAAALRSTGHIVQGPAVETFDATTDEYHYEDL